jgi:hypothetical protein
MTPQKRQQMEDKVAANAGRMNDTRRITGFQILKLLASFLSREQISHRRCLSSS